MAGPSSRNKEAKLIKLAIDNRLKQVHTYLPAKVLEVQETGHLELEVQIQQLVLPVDSNDEYVAKSMSPLVRIPPAGYRVQQFLISLPIQAGDEGMIQIAERSMIQWKQSATISPPLAMHMHELEDAVFIPTPTSDSRFVAPVNPDDATRPDQMAAENLIIKQQDGKVSLALTPDGNLYVHADELKQVNCKNLTAEVTEAATITCDTANVTSQNNTDLTVGGDLTATVGGSTDITSIGDISIQAPNLRITGTVSVTGAVNITGVMSAGGLAAINGTTLTSTSEIQALDVKTALGISLGTHKHPVSGSNTGTPTP